MFIKYYLIIVIVSPHVLFMSTLSESAYAHTVPMVQMVAAMRVADSSPDLISFHMLAR